MACTPDCHKPTPAQAHCGVCHHTFAGPTVFDKHRKAGVCLHPSRVTLGMHERNGVWGHHGSMNRDEVERRQAARALFQTLAEEAEILEGEK